MHTTSFARPRTEEILARLEALILPVVHGLGLQLWGTEYFPAGRKALLRIYIESEDGVTIEQCAMVSRQLAPALEVDETLPGSFTLEVSSPGLERRFFSPEQLQAYLSRTVHALLTEPMDGCKSFRGELVCVHGMVITLKDKDKHIPLNWDQIKKVHLIHTF